MENCLVTKLKGTVDNSNLFKLGEGIFIQKTSGYDENQWFRVFCESDMTKTAVSDAHIYDRNQVDLGTSTILDTQAKFIHMVTEGQRTKIQDIYGLTIFGVTSGVSYNGPECTFFPNLKVFFSQNPSVGFNLDKCKFKESLNELTAYVPALVRENKNTIDLSGFISLSSATLLSYNGENINIGGGENLNITLSPSSSMPEVSFGDVVSGNNLANVSSIIMSYCNFNDSSFNTFLRLTNVATIGFVSITTLSGNMSILGSLTHIETIGCPNTKNVLLVIEDFVGYARTEGRTTGSVTLLWAGAAYTTFQGVAVPNKYSVTLSWTPTTITYDGVTINA